MSSNIPSSSTVPTAKPVPPSSSAQRSVPNIPRRHSTGSLGFLTPEMYKKFMANPVPILPPQGVVRGRSASAPGPRANVGGSAGWFSNTPTLSIPSPLSIERKKLAATAAAAAKPQPYSHPSSRTGGEMLLEAEAEGLSLLQHPYLKHPTTISLANKILGYPIDRTIAYGQAGLKEGAVTYIGVER